MTLGQFADHLQMDIFYLRDLTTRNYPILGVVCDAPLCAAMRLDSRQSYRCRSVLPAWVQHFGFPLKLTTDDDGSFQAEFADYMDEGGVQLDIIAPDAPHQLGVVERRNNTCTSEPSREDR